MSKRQYVFLILGLLIAAAAVYGATRYERWKEERVSFATPAALEALQSDDQVRVTQNDWIVFEPADQISSQALIFYPGGECDERGYAELLRTIAAGGVTVILVPMPFYLAVLAPNRAEAVQAAYPEIRQWAIAGHSLGGAMAAQYADQHPGQLDGLLLWDAYPPKEIGLADRDLPVTMIHRADEAGQLPEYYAPYLPVLPPQTQFVPIAGGTHMNFGNFNLSPGAIQTWHAERPVSAAIPQAEQHRQIVKATLDFMRSLEKSG